MKATVYAALAAVVALVLAATPVKALAHDGWHHDHGRHLGWYKHGGGYDSGGYPGYWRHHHHDDDDDGGWHEHHGWGGDGGYGDGGAGYGYSGYPGGVPGYGAYYGQGYAGGQGYYGSGFAPNAGKLMQLQQTMSQRLNASRALYQAAVAQGNYKLANKLAGQMQKQSMTLNAANSMLGGAGAPGFPPYQSGYGTNPYYGQSGASGLGSILQMFGY
jgi:hypothetical protein